MAGTIVPWFRQQWLDANGAPLSLGSLETYETGTSTPLATYSDAGLTVSNGTTITLNAGGFPTVTGVEVGIFLLPRAYRFVLKNSAGATQRTIDGVYAVQAASSVNLEIDGIAGEALSANDLAYESDGSGGLTAGRWYRADADLSYASATPNLAFVPAAIAQGDTGTLRRGGIMDGFGGLVAGSTYYASATAGGITATAPAGYIRSVGVATSATTIVINWAPRSGDLALSPLNICEGRLTLTTAVPVTTSDVTAATTLYFALYTGNRIALYDGAATWNIRTFAQLSIAVPATTSTMYDVWVYDNAGAPTLEVLAWTNDTTRATALTTQDGVLVKTGATTRRYVGSFRTTGVSGQTEDSLVKRYVWNYYHRQARPMRRVESATNWTYTLAAFQQANANAANQLDFVIGVDERLVEAVVIGNGENSTAGVSFMVGIGLDAVTVTTNVLIALTTESVATYPMSTTATWRGFSGVGRHTLTWLESSEAVGATTWYGQIAFAERSGIHGTVWG